MTMQQASGKILSMILMPLVFVSLISLFVLSNVGAYQDVPPPEYIVGIASIIIVSIVAVACLLTAVWASQPRYHWG